MEQKDREAKEQPQDDQAKGPEPGAQFPAEIKLVIDEQRRITLHSPFPVPDTAFMFLRALLVLGSMQPQQGPAKEESPIIRPGNAGPFKKKP